MSGESFAVKFLRAAKQEKDGKDAGNRSGDDKDENRSASRVLETGRANGGARFGEENSHPGEDYRGQGESVPGQNELNRWFEVAKGQEKNDNRDCQGNQKPLVRIEVRSDSLHVTDRTYSLVQQQSQAVKSAVSCLAKSEPLKGGAGYVTEL